jgi:catechol 2,3-dioxygenase-like lactoylglutathione lyase family enzyme
MTIAGIHHLELTVSDLERSKRFYEKLPGLKIVANYPGFIMFAGKGFYLGLTDHAHNQKEKVFREQNVGLDHVSFSVAKREELDEAIKFFERENISHGEIKELSNKLFVLAFRDPDNIQLELAWKG